MQKPQQEENNTKITILETPDLNNLLETFRESVEQETVFKLSKLFNYTFKDDEDPNKNKNICFGFSYKLPTRNNIKIILGASIH